MPALHNQSGIEEDEEMKNQQEEDRMMTEDS